MMLYHTEPNQILTNILQQLQQSIQELVFKRNFEFTYKNYKNLALKLAYIIKHVIRRIKGIAQYRAALDQIMKMMKILVQSTEYDKYGHIFPELALLIKKYEFGQDDKNTVNRQSLVSRVKMNEQSQFYAKITENSISANELRSLTSGTVHALLQELNNNQIVLQNPQCLCCSQVFIKNFPIQNTNPMIPIFREISTKMEVNKANIVRYLTGLCNMGGGVLIIGAENKLGSTRVIGMRFNNQAEIQDYQKQIQQSAQTIRPKFTYFLERVLVHTNFLEQNFIQNSAEEYMRICFRIFIIPEHTNKLTYAEIMQKGKCTIYEAYNFNESSQSVPCSSSITQIESNLLYDLIHKKYRSKQTHESSHKNINCHRPHGQYSKIFMTYAELGLPQQKNSAEQAVDQYPYFDTPEFKYPYASLLVISSKQNDRFKEDLCDALKQRKKAYKIERPYQQSFKQNVRSIWMMTHEISTVQLKKILKYLQTKDIITPKTIKLMPVHKVLQIQMQKYTEYTKKTFSKSFSKKFTEPYKAETCKVEGGNSVVHLYFNDLSQSVYAYLIFEQMQIFSYFIKEGGAYLKK